MALKDKLTGNNQTVRSQSASQLTNITPSSTLSIKTTSANHSNESRANDKTTPVKTITITTTNADIKNNSNITPTINSNNSNSYSSNTLKAKLKANKTSASVINTNANTNTISNSNSNSKSNSNSNYNSNSHCNVNMSTNSYGINVSGSNCTSSENPNGNSSVGPAVVPPKPLVTHGRSHSVNDIKINGNQLKLVPTPVDDIGIGVKDMKAGSRAPIALSEEL